MSGGSLDYCSYKIDDTIELIKQRSRRNLHLAFTKHLALVSQALHDLEWEFSGDTGEKDADEAIRKVITKSDEIESATDEANRVLEALKEVLND